jgi:hypothetical protein
LIPVNIELPPQRLTKSVIYVCVKSFSASPLSSAAAAAATAPLSFSDHPQNSTTAGLVLPPNKQPMNYSSVSRCVNKQAMGDNANEMFCWQLNLHNYAVWGLILRQIMWKINIIIVSDFPKQKIISNSFSSCSGRTHLSSIEQKILPFFFAIWLNFLVCLFVPLFCLFLVVLESI